jgi:Fic family protein
MGELSEAERRLGELAGIGHLLPNPHLLISPYVRREAVLSSKIEGTITSVSDLFIFEAAPSEQPKSPDVREVHNYVRALEHGLKRLPELPLSLRLIRELHRELMRGVRGQERTPGEFRTRQNWIGPPDCSLQEATYVPPPVDQLQPVLSDWEKFAHRQEQAWPPLVQCALLHYQFEAIHPFADGNGRVGRLLIILFLSERGLLPRPLLYLSAFFERHRSEYYNRLQAVTEKGDWEGWLSFFLRGVAVQSQDAVERSQRILALYQEFRSKLLRARVTAPAVALLDEVFINPYVTISGAREKLKVSYPTAQAAVQRLVSAGILTEVTRRWRNRIYCALELRRMLEGGGPSAGS